MKMVTVGSVDCRFSLMFKIRNAGGKMVTANLYHYETLAEVYETLEKFYAARKRVIRKYSNSILGGGYEPNSVEWLACHSCTVVFYDALKDKIRRKYFQQPYLEQIAARFDN